MQKFENNWQSTLLAGVSASATSAQIPAGDAAKLSLSGADYYVMTLASKTAQGGEDVGPREIVHVTAVSGQTLTLLRGQEGTAAAAWSTGTNIEMRVTAAALARHEQATGGGATNLSVTRTATTVTVGSSTGDDAVLPEATGTQAGVLSAADKAKLNGLDSALAGKQNTEAGKGLSSNDYTTAEKNKLAGLEASKWKGLHASLSALQTAHPTAAAGDFADVDTGAGADVVRYLWDVSDAKWVAQQGSGGSMTPAQVKSAYESNADTNAYTDSEKTKLASVAAGATANGDTDSLNEGASNLYHTAARVRDTVLAGLSTATNAVITAADSVLTALGKLQAQIAGKEATLTAGTNITIDRSNPNAPVISAAASGGGGSGEGITKANFLQKFFAHEIAVTPEDVNRFKDVGIAVSQASFGNYTPARTCSTGYSDGGSVLSYSTATGMAYGFIPGANAASFAAVAGGSILEGSYAAENDFIKFALSNVAQVEYEYIIKCNAIPNASNPYYVAMGGGLSASKVFKPGDNGGGFAVTLADNENAGQFRFVYRSDAGVPTYVDLTGGITANQNKKIRISLTRAGTSGPWTANIYIDDVLMTTVVDLGFIYTATYIAPGARFFRTAANSNTVVFYIKSARAAVLLK